MKRLLPLLIVCLLSYFSVRPLLSAGYFPMHDDTQVSRVIEMGRAIREGQFPVRWVADLGYGYGYPIFNFYGPLPYYVGGIFYALGVPAVGATKLMFGIGIVLPSLVLYLVVSPVVGVFGAMVSSVLYLYAPYHAVQIYVRGAVGEYWVLLFWPLILSAFLRRKSLAGAVGLSGSILSHTLLGYATTLFLFLGMGAYWLIRLVQHRVDMTELKAETRWFALGLGLSAFFWLPALVEMQYTNVAAQVTSTANYRDHFVCLIQLWSSAWGFGGSAPGCVRDGLSFMLGKLQLVLAALSLLGLTLIGKKVINRAYMVVALFATAIGSILTLAISGPLWRILPGFSYLQYPWRFLSLAGFGLALLGGSLVTLVRGTLGKVITAGLIVIAALAMNAKWFTPQYLYQKDSKAFEAPLDLEWRASRISDEYLPKDFSRPVQESQVVSATIRSSEPVKQTLSVSTAIEKQVVVESTRAATVTINTAYFPGMQYRVNGDDVHPAISGGLPQLTIGPGQSVISIRLTSTPVRTVGNILSGLSLMTGIFIYVKQKKTNG